MSVEVRPIEFCNDVFAPMLAEANEEGGSFLSRLRDEWLNGELRFDRPGEILLGAFSGPSLVAVGGISLDPYSSEPGLGRVRHVYVLVRYRGRGIGRQLVAKLIDHARGRFDMLRLTTKHAGDLYEDFGFVRCEAPKQTHRLTL